MRFARARAVSALMATRGAKRAVAPVQNAVDVSTIEAGDNINIFPHNDQSAHPDAVFTVIILRAHAQGRNVRPLLMQWPR